MKHLLGFILALSFLLGPVLLFPSGMPQPADLLTVGWALLVFAYLRGRLQISGEGLAAIKIGGVLVFWMTLISIWNAFFYQDEGIAFSSLFYIFNLSVCVLLCSLLQQDFRYWINIINVGCVLSAILLVIMVFAGFKHGAMRQTGSFNNPNQLGYFAIIIVAISFLVSPHARFPRLSMLVIMVAGLVGVVASASLSSLGALIMMVSAVVFRRLSLKRAIGLGIVTLAAAAIGLLVLSQTQIYADITQAWESRIGAIDRKTEDISGTRGYDRILDFPEHMVVGAGERGRWRFGPQNSFEIHSSMGTLLFSYGLPGLLLFFLFVFQCFRSAPPWGWIVLSGLIAYSITHQGLRSTHFWIFMILASVVFSKTRQQGPQHAGLASPAPAPGSVAGNVQGQGAA